jgi:hypothetical protein
MFILTVFPNNSGNPITNEEHNPMDRFSKEELKELMTPSGERCVSIYLPTHRASEEGRQDLIRFKNLIKAAEEQLVQGGLRRPEAKEFLTPLQKLLEDPSFWQSRSDGAAVFLSPKLFRSFRLPVPFEELAVVARRFHLKPLISLLTEDQEFFLLALSQKDIRLLRGERLGVREVELENVPRSLAEALRYDEPERALQFKGKVPVGTGGRRFALVFAHGVGTGDSKDDIRRYLLQVDRGLHEVLRFEQAPLVLAGVEYILPIYREVNTYPHLLADGIMGNPELLSPEELHARAWKVVLPYLRKAREAAISHYKELAGGGKTSRELTEIIPAAAQGRVYKLFLTPDVQVWGNFHPDTGTVERPAERTADSEDLLDLAALQTMLNGGTVYPVEAASMPDISPIAAVFRY